MEKNLYFLPKFRAFGIADGELTDCRKTIPVIKFSDKCYKKLGIALPINPPKIGCLLGRENGYYTIGYNYAYAIVKSGAEPIFLDYQNCTEQLAGCSGLILPGGSFNSPDWYYNPKAADQLLYPNERSQAYAYSLHTALAMGIPVLGICAGAQVIAAECGSRLASVQSLHPGINHKTQKRFAHLVKIVKDSPLYDLIGQPALVTNSRHNEAVVDLPTLDCYARSQDGILEAWGSVKDKLLGVQWNPEDCAVTGNALHQKVYDWLATEARLC